MKIVMVSESEFTVQGHGVHTAYKESVSALQRAGVDVVVNDLKPSGLRHIHTLGPYSMTHLLKSGKKVVSAHVLPDSFVGSLIFARYWRGSATSYLRWFYNQADVVIAVSEYTKKELLKLGVTSPIVTIPNMVNVKLFKDCAHDKATLRKELGYAEDDWIIVGNGQVQPRKRVDTFIQVAKELPQFKFLWIGGIPFKGLACDRSTMEEIMENPPPNCHFTGVIPLEDVPKYYSIADTFFLPSEQETFCIAVIEAAATGLPVVLRDIPDYEYTFKNDAVLAKEEAFKQTLLDLKEKPEFYREYKEKAANIAHRYDSDIVVKDLIKVYQDLEKEPEKPKIFSKDYFISK